MKKILFSGIKNKRRKKTRFSVYKTSELDLLNSLFSVKSEEKLNNKFEEIPSMNDAEPSQMPMKIQPKEESQMPSLDLKSMNASLSNICNSMNMKTMSNMNNMSNMNTMSNTMNNTMNNLNPLNNMSNMNNMSNLNNMSNMNNMNNMSNMNNLNNMNNMSNINNINIMNNVNNANNASNINNSMNNVMNNSLNNTMNNSLNNSLTNNPSYEMRPNENTMFLNNFYNFMPNFMPFSLMNNPFSSPFFPTNHSIAEKFSLNQNPFHRLSDSLDKMNLKPKKNELKIPEDLKIFSLSHLDGDNDKFLMEKAIESKDLTQNLDVNFDGNTPNFLQVREKDQNFQIKMENLEFLNLRVKNFSDLSPMEKSSNNLKLAVINMEKNEVYFLQQGLNINNAASDSSYKSGSFISMNNSNTSNSLSAKLDIIENDATDKRSKFVKFMNNE